MKILHLMSAIILTSVMCGCSGQNATCNVRIEPNWQETYDIQGIVKDVQYVELQTPDTVLVWNVRKLRVMDGMIILSDGSSLFFFGRDGDFQSRLNRRGRGPGEYFDILDFTCSKEKIYIIDRNAGLFCYDIEGTPLCSRHLDFYPATICITEKGIIVTSAYQKAGNKFNLLDKETFETLSGFQPIDPAEMTYRHLMGQNNFFRHNGHLLFHEPMNNEICEILSDSLRTHANIDLMGRNAPRSFWHQKFDNIMDLNIKANAAEYCFGFPEYGEGQNSTVFTYRDGSSYRMCVFDKASGVAVQFDSVSVRNVNFRVGELIWDLSDEDSAAFLVTCLKGDKGQADEQLTVGIGKLP